MGFFDSFKRPDINEVLEKLELEEKAVLLDVRTPQEYQSGHIPGSKNIPLDRLQKASGVIKDKDTAVYVYCQSGGRSKAAIRISYLPSGQWRIRTRSMIMSEEKRQSQQFWQAADSSAWSWRKICGRGAWM